MSVNISYFAGAGWQFFDNDGNILSGGKIYTYTAGTTTPAPSYTDKTGLIANANPIILDSSGRVPNEIWLPSGVLYKFILKTSSDVLIGTYDNLTSVPSINGQPANVTDFGAVGNGITDDTTAINNALTAVSLNNGGSLYFPSGTYMVSSIIQVPSNIKIFGDGAATIIKCKNAIARGVPNGDAQGQSISLGSNCSVANLVLDGGDFDSGGIVVTHQSNVLIENVTVQNTVDTTGCQAFQIASANNVQITNCFATKVTQGVQGYLAKTLIINSCIFNLCVAGIFTAGCEYVTASNNVISNCSDVGLDFEGGTKCTFTGNEVTRCNNGELSIFQDGTATGLGCKNLSWIGNTVHRQSNYTQFDGTIASVNTASGAILIASLDADTENVVFSDNAILVDASAGLCWLASTWPDADCDVTISNNTFTTYSTSQLFNVSIRARALKYINNTHNVYSVIGTSANFKNMRNGLISGNKFWTNQTQSVVLIQLYSDAASQQTCVFSHNDFDGFGDYAVYVNQYVSGYRTYTLINNKFTVAPTANGGLTVNKSFDVPAYIDQTILIGVTDATNPTVSTNFQSLQAIDSNSSSYIPNAEILCSIDIGGVNGNTYKLLYQKDVLYSMTGSGSASGITASTSYYLTVSGTTATMTKPSPGVNYSWYEVRLNSPILS